MHGAEAVHIADRPARRVCLLTQYFPPEMGAPQARLSELGERLIDRGWQVEALTALPNYPTGRIFPGYPRFRPMRETIGRIQVARVPIYASQRGFVRRLGSYFSFVASATAFGPRLCHRPHVLFVESPPLFIGYAALALARLWNCPYVFNVSDLWPASALRMSYLRAGFASRQAERLERSLYTRAAAVTGQSQEIIAEVQATAPGTRVGLVTNGVDPDRFGRAMVDDEARALIGPEPGPVFIYAGLFGLAQGLGQLLDLAASLPADVPGRFVLVGDGPEREQIEQRLAREEIGRVRVLPPQTRERVPALLAAADVAVIPLAMDIPGSVPSKIYEAMASELPILIIASGEAAHRVEAPGAGLAVRPGDLSAARSAFIQLVRDGRLRARMGACGRLTAETLYNRNTIAGRLDDLLREVTDGAGSSRRSVAAV